MARAAMVAESRTQTGIHAVDSPLEVMLLLSGSSFRLACSDCRRTIARNLTDADEIGSRRELMDRHRLECSGPRQQWIRRMIRLFALS